VAFLSLISLPDADPDIAPSRHRPPRCLAVRGREDQNCIARFHILLFLLNKVGLAFLVVLLLMFLSGDRCGRGGWWPSARVWSFCPRSAGSLAGGGCIWAARPLYPSSSECWSAMVRMAATFHAGCGSEGNVRVAWVVVATDAFAWILSLRD
jgi:hypothetical protein